MYSPAEYEPTEVFECDDYIYAKSGRGWGIAMDLAQDLGVRPPAKVLDIGCGFGTITTELRAFGYEAYGVESRPVVPVDGRYFFREDARRTHFPNSFFDVVVDKLATAQLFRINKRPDVVVDILKELRRVTRSGGILFSYSSSNDLKAAGIEQYAVGPKLLDDMGRFYCVYQFN